MRFAFDPLKSHSGAELYVKLFQISSVLPLPYIFIASGSLSVVTKKGPLSFLFDLGVSMLPRWEALGLSALYRKTGSELALFFLILIIALAFGLFSKRIFRGSEKKALRSRIAFLTLIGADLVLRLIPFGFVPAFGAGTTVLAFAFRIACFLSVLLDIVFERKKAK